MVRTLIVEDDGPFRSMLKELLQERFPQLDIEVAKDAGQALELAQSFEPELVFTDIRLPRGNGLDLSVDIKARYPRAVIIVLSSHDLPEYRNVIQSSSADHFLFKHASLYMMADRLLLAMPTIDS